MRTIADKQRDVETSRYEAEGDHDPLTPSGARAILKSAGGSKAAKLAISDMWAQAKKPGQGYLPTARISAPLRVVQALATVGVAERADDDRGVSFRYRLTEMGLDMAVKSRG